jgi:hypothetical protein
MTSHQDYKTALDASFIATVSQPDIMESYDPRFYYSNKI